MCGFPDLDDPEGPGLFVGPFKIGGKGNAVVNVHESCALCCPEVSKEGPHWYNVCKAVRRARKSKCSGCGQTGATIGCWVETCKVNLHWHCAVASGAPDIPETAELIPETPMPKAETPTPRA